jgi:hypothetical protein
VELSLLALFFLESALVKSVFYIEENIKRVSN